MHRLAHLLLRERHGGSSDAACNLRQATRAQRQRTLAEGELGSRSRARRVQRTLDTPHGRRTAAEKGRAGTGRDRAAVRIMRCHARMTRCAITPPHSRQGHHGASRAHACSSPRRAGPARGWAHPLAAPLPPPCHLCGEPQHAGPCSTMPGPGRCRLARRSSRRRGGSRASGPAPCWRTCPAGAALRRSLPGPGGRGKQVQGLRRLRNASRRPTRTNSSWRSRCAARGGL